MVGSHVGLAIFNPRSFPTQWVLVLSTNELFQGRVICSTVGTTVNGWREIWMECECSPASFNRSAPFGGVVHLAVLTQPMEVVQSHIKSNEIGSKNPAYTDQYVLQTLRRIGNRGFEPSGLLSREKELYDAIQARIAILDQFRCTNSTFPVASLSLDGVRVGKVQWR